MKSAASAGGGAPPSDVAAFLAQELAALAADAQTLGSLLAPGDVVKAVVLPPNGLTDLLEIGGLRVAAELPPALLPGETITVMVTGSSGDRIHLHIIPVYDAGTGEPAVENGRQRGAAAGAALRIMQRTAQAAPTAARTVAAPAGPKPVPVVKDTGRPGMGAPSGARALVLAQGAATGPSGKPDGPPGSSRSTPRTSPPPANLKSIEARLAAAHATTTPTAGPPGTGVPRPAASAVGSGEPLRPRPGAASTAARPFIGVRLPGSPAAASRVPDGGSGELLGRSMEPTALLRALNLPVTATNLAAARQALQTPDKLPDALMTLERAVSGLTEPRLRTLSTLTSFLARLDPRSPVLGTQIAAFVDHVVTGREAKLAALASLPATGERTERNAAPVPSAERENTAPAAGAERVAFIRTSLDYDLKSLLLGFSAARAGAPDAAEPRAAALDHAVSGALSAITALQLNASAILAAHPDGLTFTVPVALADGFAQARVRIDREVPASRGVPLDGDNFHIAFVLETRHLGTVAVELSTVGRAVTLSVKTEAAPAQRIFGRALTELTARLESLRYVVAKADAVVAPAGAPVEPVLRPPSGGPAQLVDTDA